MKTATEETRREPTGPYPGRLTLYHPNREGSGTALRLELRLSRRRDDRYDCFFLEMARQKPSEERGRGPARFDWQNRATVKLDFADICEILLVLEGRKERAGGARANGIYHENGGANTLIDVRRDAERGGIGVGLSKKTKGGEQLFRGRLLLSEAEALGLRCVFQSGLFFMVYHGSLESAPAGR